MTAVMHDFSYQENPFNQAHHFIYIGVAEVLDCFY
jgi:hypothetical protein